MLPRRMRAARRNTVAKKGNLSEQAVVKKLNAEAVENLQDLSESMMIARIEDWISAQ